MTAYGHPLLLAVSRTPLSTLRLPQSDLVQIKKLGLASRSTRRWCRGGNCAKRARVNKQYLQFGLVNARSICNKPHTVQDLIVSSKIDMLAITETWIPNQDDESALLAACPTGYSACHRARSHRLKKTGGGVAIVYRSTMRAFVQQPILYTSFEYTDVVMSVNSLSFRVIVVYRSPEQSLPCFLTDFAHLLEVSLAFSGKLLIVGDFNIHLEHTSDALTIRFLELIDSFGLVQLVKESTHIKDGILDLVLCRSGDSLVLSANVTDIFSDHFVVQCTLRISKPLLPLKKITFRPLKKIDIASFASDLAQLPVITDPASTCEALLEQYNTGVSQVLDKHAPLVSKSVVLRPVCPWFNDDIAEARRFCRRAERRWRLRKLTVDKEILLEVPDTLATKIRMAKTSYLRNKISECGNDRRALFFLLNQFLSRKQDIKLPQHKSLEETLNVLGSFFQAKILDIRSGLDSTPVGDSEDIPITFVGEQLSSFRPVSATEITSMANYSPSKSCCLDPIPTFLLKQVIPVLASPISQIINLSLSSGHMPTVLKSAVITPLLKKTGLDPDCLSNYRSISNLPFIAKLIERTVATQTVTHLTDNDLFVPVQSAYRSGHSTETALVRVFNDLLLSVDRDNCSALVLLDLSAAFDTVDHQMLLDRLSNQFGVSDGALDWFKSYFSGRS